MVRTVSWNICTSIFLQGCNQCSFRVYNTTQVHASNVHIFRPNFKIYQMHFVVEQNCFVRFVDLYEWIQLDVYHPHLETFALFTNVTLQLRNQTNTMFLQWCTKILQVNKTYAPLMQRPLRLSASEFTKLFHFKSLGLTTPWLRCIVLNFFATSCGQDFLLNID